MNTTAHDSQSNNQLIYRLAGSKTGLAAQYTYLALLISYTGNYSNLHTHIALLNLARSSSGGLGT